MNRNVVLLLCAVGIFEACTGGSRDDARAVISGSVKLVSTLAGANDLSRVRIDIGRGEGGITPDADGNFEISDLEPDAYTVSISYIGGLIDASAGSAYAPYSTRVSATAGSSTALGVVELPLGRATVRGSFNRTDSGSLSGLVIKLLSGDGTLETVSTDGTFEFAQVPVGRYQLFADRDGLAGVCGQSVVVPADAQEVLLPLATLSSSAVTLAPGETGGVSQAWDTEGARWYLRGGSVTVVVGGSTPAQGRFWKAGEAAPQYSQFNNAIAVSGLTENASNAVSFQFMDACGQESDVHSLDLRWDTTPPLVSARLNSGTYYASEPTMLLELDAYDGLSEPLEMQQALCNDGVCTPASVADAQWQPALPVGEVTFSDVDGLKSVKLRVRDRSQNTSDVELAVVLRAELDREAPTAVTITVDGQPAGTPITAYAQYVVVNVVATGATEIRSGINPTLDDAPWVPFASGAAFSKDLGVSVGTVTLHVQLRDAADNRTQVFAVPVSVDNRGIVRGRVRLPGMLTRGGAIVSLLGTQFNATTGDDDTFVISGVPAGLYNMELSAEGFVSQRLLGLQVTPPLELDVGDMTLAPVRGRVTGVVMLEAQASHGGVAVALRLDDGSELTTVTDGAGVFTIPLPPGTYNGGLTTTLRRFAPAGYSSPIVILDDQTFNVGEMPMTQVENDLLGTVAMEGASDHSGVAVTVFGEPGGITENVMRNAVTDAAGSWRVESLPIGNYRMHVELANDALLERADRAFVVEKGPPTQMPLLTLRRRFVIINDNAGYTRTRDVTLTLSRSTDCLEMQVSNEQTFAGITREPCVATKPWQLLTGAGLRTVYARFYTNSSPSVPSEVVQDDITLDGTAAISAFTYSPTGTLSVGTRVTFRATAGEAGTMTVTIPSYVAGLLLNDDGRSGDATANDGIYSLEYVLDVPKDVGGGTVATANFVDLAGNTATRNSTAIVIAVPPLISNIRESVDTQANTFTISFDTDEPTTAVVNYGPAITYGSSVSSTTSQRSHSVIISTVGFPPGTTYHYQIDAKDAANNHSVTVDRPFTLVPTTPAHVAAIPGSGRNWVRWELPNQKNLRGVHIERSALSTGPFSRLTSEPYTHEVNLYEDATVTDDVEYWYQVITVDGSGTESTPSEPRNATPGGNTGPTDVSGSFIRGVENPTGVYVWSARGSPYIITGNIRIDREALLVIGPGTVVKAPKTRVIEVEGRIAILGARGTITTDAQGNPVESDDGMVEMTSNEVAPARYDWKGIQLDDAVRTPHGYLVLDRDEGRYLGGDVFHRVRFRHTGYQSAYAISDNDTGGHPGGMYVAHSQFLEGVAGVKAYGDQVVLRDLTFDDLTGSALYTIVRHALLENLTVTGASANVGTISPRCSGGSAVVRMTSCRVLLRDSRFEGLAGGLGTGEGTRIVDIEMRGLTGSATAISGAGTTTRSLFEDNARHVSGGTVAYSTLRRAREVAISSSAAFGNDISDTGCTTACQGERIDINAYDDVIGNVIRANSPTIRTAAISVTGNATSAGNVRYNHIYVPGSGFSVVRGRHASALFTSNSFLAPIAPADILYLVDNVSYLAGVMLNATQNYWGTVATTQMQALPRGDIDVIYDTFEETALREVDYSGFVTSGYPMPTITEPWFAQRFYVGEAVTLTGSATDPEETPVTLAWVMDSGTPLGSGSTQTVSNLQPGPYRAWLVATDGAGQEARVPVDFEVWPAP